MTKPPFEHLPRADVVDDLLAAGRIERDVKKRAAIYAEAQKRSESAVCSPGHPLEASGGTAQLIVPAARRTRECGLPKTRCDRNRRATLSAMRQPRPSIVRARALERVREITCQVLGDRDVRIYLFGSSVSGRAHRWSDIDVAIDAVHALPSALLAELRERLEDSDIPYDVDIVDLSKASPEIRASVAREGVLWGG